MLSSSARRIDYPLAPARGTRVIGFDTEASAVVAAAAKETWADARFYSAQGGDLVSVQGQREGLADALAGSDALVMVAATGENAAAVAVVGAACEVRGIMTAGLVLAAGDALTALRPYARMVLVPADGDDLTELLRAIRA